MKIYKIHTATTTVTAANVETAIDYVRQIDLPNDSPTPYGFLTLHHGEQFLWLLIDLWFTDILRHFVHAAPLDQTSLFGVGPQDGTCCCVWELEVTKHERDKWVEHVLSKPEQPDFERYLSAELSISAPSMNSV